MIKNLEHRYGGDNAIIRDMWFTLICLRGFPGGGVGVHVADLLQIKLKLVQMKKIHKGFSSKIKNGWT